MKIIKSSVEIEGFVDGPQMLKNIERYGRVCYKSEDKMSELSTEKFIRGLIMRGHESPLEHEKVTVRIICDRGVSHELVRHRLASYTQESTRYCRYEDGITVIEPEFVDGTGNLEVWSERHGAWMEACEAAEKAYLRLLNSGATPQEARAVLPTCTKTEIVVTANLREWRHIFWLRLDEKAHPEIRRVIGMVLDVMKVLVPVVFDDIGETR